MKNNWLSVSFGVFCALFSSFAFSLGLGGITTESVINEPLIAEIELINVGDLENNQILVSIGTDSDYQLAGVTKEYFHSGLQFEVQVEGVANPRIIVRSSDPLVDPYLNFLVQIRWPQGRLLREYTLLLDMPLFAQQSATPAVTSSSSATAPTTARQAVAQQANQQNAPQQTATTRTVAPRNVSSISSGQNYTVSSGETLWGIAEQVSRSTGTSVHQAMVALHEQNRNAFVNGDINLLRANSTLQVPAAAQMTSRTEGQAARDFTTLSQQATATPIQAAANNFRDAINDGTQSEGGRLTLSSPADNTGGSAADTGDSAEQDALRETIAETINENATLKEQLDAAAIEQQEADERIANLEEQIRLMEEQRLLELENATLTNVQEVPEVEQPEPAPVVETEPETFFDKLGAFRYWILGGLALLIVAALVVAMLVIRGRKSSDIDELYYDDEILEEDTEELFVEEEEAEKESELDEGIEEMAADLLDDDEDNEIDEEVFDDEDDLDEHEEDLVEEEPEEQNPASEALESIAATSFEDSDDEEDLGLGEFEDLDEFFSGDSSDATQVLFGSEDDEESSDESDESIEDILENSEDEIEDVLTDEEAALEFTAPDLTSPAESIEEESEASDDEQDDLLDFDISDLSTDKNDDESEINLEDDFGFAEPGLTDDLDADAEADFGESIEVHSSEMDDLLVPIDEDSDTDLLADDVPEVPQDAFEEAAEELIEELDEDNAETLLEDEQADEQQEELVSPLEVPEDLDLDEDMDADLGEFDLDADDLDLGDSDEEFLTKLELAEAYIEMGDVQGAKELLKEVEEGGNEEQKATARSFLEQFKGDS